MGWIKAVTQAALGAGFSFAAALDPRAVILREEARLACAENKCGAYNTRWSCPPACGPLEGWEARLRGYGQGLLMQTTGALADPFDYDAMRDAGIRHGENLERFARMYPEALVLGAGPCERCRACAYPEGPCRCPEGPRFSMEAAGIIVSEVCAAHNLPYYRGPNTITYTACALSGIR